MGLFDKVKQVSENAAQQAQEKVTQSVENMQDNREAQQLAKQEQKQAQQLDKQEQQELAKVFNASRTMGDVSIDTKNNLFKVKRATADAPKKSGALMKTGKALAAVYTLGASVAIEHAMKPSDRVFRFSEIRSYELLQDDSQLTSGGLGAAVVGGALFGGSGAVAGSVIGKKKTKKVIENLLLRIDLSDFDFPCVIVPYITKSTKVDSNDYKKALSAAQQTISCLDLIIQQVNESGAVPQETPSNGESAIDEVKKLKELVDMGILTTDEFEMKKKELLGL